MKATLRSTLFAAACAAGLIFTSTIRAAEAGEIEFGPVLEGISSKQCVEVNLPEPLLNFAAVIAKSQEPDAAALIKDLKHVRVHVLGIDDKNRDEIASRVHKIRDDLAARGWHRAVNVQDNGDDVAVMVKLGPKSAIEGLAITVLGKDNEAVFVNIVGSIDPSRIAALGEKYGIDPLKEIRCAPEKTTPAAPMAPEAPTTAS